MTNQIEIVQMRVRIVRLRLIRNISMIRDIKQKCARISWKLITVDLVIAVAMLTIIENYDRDKI